MDDGTKTCVLSRVDVRRKTAAAEPLGDGRTGLDRAEALVCKKKKGVERLNRLGEAEGVATDRVFADWVPDSAGSLSVAKS